MSKYLNADGVTHLWTKAKDTFLGKAGGTMTGAVVVGGTQDGATAQARNIVLSTTDLTAGTSTLATGTVYMVYE
jgi:hypothetical protein